MSAVVQLHSNMPLGSDMKTFDNPLEDKGEEEVVDDEPVSYLSVGGGKGSDMETFENPLEDKGEEEVVDDDPAVSSSVGERPSRVRAALSRARNEIINNKLLSILVAVSVFLTVMTILYIARGYTLDTRDAELATANKQIAALKTKVHVCEVAPFVVSRPVCAAWGAHGMPAGILDTDCVACKEECAAGHGVQTHCNGATSDTMCEACVAGSTFSATATNMLEACQSCSKCPAGQGVAAGGACTPTKDSDCTACVVGSSFSAANDAAACTGCTSSCGADEYKTECTAEADSSCVMCSTCPVGEGVISTCTATSDTVCEACSQGSSFSAVNSNVACETCATCPAGEGVARWVRVQRLYSLP